MFDKFSATSIGAWVIMALTVVANIIKTLIPESEGPINAILSAVADLNNLIVAFGLNLARMRTLSPGWPGFVGRRS